MNDPRNYAGEPVCGLGIVCTSDWPNCITVEERFGTPRDEACKIACQVYNWVECDACIAFLAAEADEDRTFEMNLEQLMEWAAPGSYDWSWTYEFFSLYKTPRFRALVEDIAENGINEPVLVGDDGRIWDGHHRICAAIELGLDLVPVTFARVLRRTDD